MRIAAVGDIAFTGRHAGSPSGEVFATLAESFSGADLVVGNLESPLTARGAPQWRKCALRGDPGWAWVLKDAGFHVLSLANNHLIDYGERGLLDTMEALNGAGIHFVGAGINREKACAPLFLTVQGQRVAILARTQVVVSSPSYATDERSGVAWLDEAEILATIAAAREKTDMVVLLLHWGIENYSYPSPEQRRLAGRLCEAGCSLILGHHPHVLQGVERVRDSLVIYSLGNFLFDEFEWEFRMEGQAPRRMFQALGPGQREGMILQVVLEGGSLSKFTPEFAVIGSEGVLKKDQNAHRQHAFRNLCSGLLVPGYRSLWRSYALWREWQLRIKPQCFPEGFFKRIGKVRLRHFKEIFSFLRKSLHVVAEKSSNPYE